MVVVAKLPDGRVKVTVGGHTVILDPDDYQAIKDAPPYAELPADPPPIDLKKKKKSAATPRPPSSTTAPKA